MECAAKEGRLCFDGEYKYGAKDGADNDADGWNEAVTEAVLDANLLPPVQDT